MNRTKKYIETNFLEVDKLLQEIKTCVNGTTAQRVRDTVHEAQLLLDDAAFLASKSTRFKST